MLLLKELSEPKQENTKKNLKVKVFNWIYLGFSHKLKKHIARIKLDFK